MADEDVRLPNEWEPRVADLCVDTQTVPCVDVAPEDGTSVLTDVEVTYSETDGWTEPAECEWTCDGGFAEDTGSCINQKLVPCDVEVAPENASSPLGELVIVTYTDAAGWTDAVCPWVCNPDHDLVADACVDSLVVECRDVAPPNATSDVVPVTITFTDAAGWTDPADCQWTCDTYLCRDSHDECVVSTDIVATATDSMVSNAISSLNPLA